MAPAMPRPAGPSSPSDGVRPMGSGSPGGFGSHPGSGGRPHDSGGTRDNPAPSCAEAACMDAGCGVASGASKMNYVGAGNGDYITETSYKYVGSGAGNLTLVTPRKLSPGPILALVGALLALAAVVALMPREGSPASTSKAQLALAPAVIEPASEEMGECTFWGDPHLVSFDKARPSFYGNGEYWIVKAEGIKIQGRYMGTKYTKGLAATNKIIVGGAFVNHHRIAVGTLESGELLIDGQPVLQNFPSTISLPSSAGSVSYNGEGILVDEATKIWSRHVVTMTLPRDVTITVFRWANYLDLRIQMPRIPGMDGSCGNFNNDPSDDTTVAVFSRIGARIEKGLNMFNRRVNVGVTKEEEKMLQLCPGEKRTLAGKLCENELPPGASLYQNKSCQLDHCFGSNEHVLKMAKELGI